MRLFSSRIRVQRSSSWRHWMWRREICNLYGVH